MARLGKHFASSIFAVVLAVLAVIISEQSTSAQLVGTDICACQPSVYKFKLNFSLSCIDTTVEGPGITETACNVNSRDSNENVTNPFPITVSEVQVLELGQSLQVVGSSVYGGTFFDGDEISYTSITVTEPGTIDAATIPRGFQVFITGINSDEDPLVNQWAITYSNDCGIFPLLEIGDLIGWTNFVSRSILKRASVLITNNIELNISYIYLIFLTLFTINVSYRRISGSRLKSFVQLPAQTQQLLSPLKRKRPRCLLPLSHQWLVKLVHQWMVKLIPREPKGLRPVLHTSPTNQRTMKAKDRRNLALETLKEDRRDLARLEVNPESLLLEWQDRRNLRSQRVVVRRVSNDVGSGPAVATALNRQRATRQAAKVEISDPVREGRQLR